MCAAQVQDGGGAHRLPSVRSPLRGQEGRLHTLLPGSRGGLCLIEQAGVGLLPDHNIGDAEVGEGLPGLDETQLGFRQRELGHCHPAPNPAPACPPHWMGPKAQHWVRAGQGGAL